MSASLPLLRLMCSDRRRAVRCAALTVLRRFHGGSAEDALPDVVELVGDSCGEVRSLAFAIMDKFGPELALAARGGRERELRPKRAVLAARAALQRRRERGPSAQPGAEAAGAG